MPCKNIHSLTQYKSISWNVASLNMLAHDAVNLLYYNVMQLKLLSNTYNPFLMKTQI